MSSQMIDGILENLSESQKHQFWVHVGKMITTSIHRGTTLGITGPLKNALSVFIAQIIGDSRCHRVLIEDNSIVLNVEDATMSINGRTSGHYTKVFDCKQQFNNGMFYKSCTGKQVGQKTLFFSISDKAHLGVIRRFMEKPDFPITFKSKTGSYDRFVIDGEWRQPIVVVSDKPYDCPNIIWFDTSDNFIGFKRYLSDEQQSELRRLALTHVCIEMLTEVSKSIPVKEPTFYSLSLLKKSISHGS